MLLEGVVQHLPRTHFLVIVCPIISPGKRLSRKLEAVADHVEELPLRLNMARSILMDLRLDVIVYADMNGEPVSHFLGYARLAKVQAVFWGNPITTGNPSIDYFVSADILEGSNRTFQSEDQEMYSEQVVLLGGQGIWYSPPELPPALTETHLHLKAEMDLLDGAEFGAGARLDNIEGLGGEERGVVGREAGRMVLRQQLKAKLGLDTSSVVYMCPQSLFKLHPSFDHVLRDILEGYQGLSRSAASSHSVGKQSTAYLVLTEGRRARWTAAFLERLSRAAPEIMDRVHVVPRTASGKEFYTLLASADVLLHPFPFGGSRTSADGLAVGVPVVVMEGTALPGRMAYSLYKTMGMAEEGGTCCVAQDRESYVKLAIDLAVNRPFRRHTSELIDQRVSSIWGRMEVVAEWARFLARAGGIHLPPSWEAEAEVSSKPSNTAHQNLRAQTALGLEQSLISSISGTPLEPSAIVEETTTPVSTNGAMQSKLMDGVGRLQDLQDLQRRLHYESDSTKIIIPFLEEFRDLHRDGDLAQAAHVLRTALAVLEESVQMNAKFKEGSNMGLEFRSMGVQAAEEREDRRDNDNCGTDIDVGGLLNDLGCTLQQLWQLEEAEEMLKLAIGLKPGYVSAMMNLGVTLQAMSKQQEAETWYREAVRLALPETRDSCLFNLAMLLREQGRLEEVADFLTREMEVPDLESGGWEAAALSVVVMRPHHRKILHGLQARKKMPFILWDEVLRLQSMYPVSSNSLVVVLGLLGKLDRFPQLLQEISGIEPLYTASQETELLPRELHTQIHRQSSAVKQGAASTSQAISADPSRGGINLVMQYYRPEVEARKEELDMCLRSNLLNPLVQKVHIFLEERDRRQAEVVQGVVQETNNGDGSELKNGPHGVMSALSAVLDGLGESTAGKAAVVGTLDRRMTFQDAFSYANQELNGEVVILANADIFFDKSLARLGDPETLRMESKLFALAKWETWSNRTFLRHTGAPSLLPRIDSQDAWVFRAPVPESVVEGSAFPLGQPRCDGRIARLFVQAGFEVSNPSLSLVAHHVHAPPR
ncbi:unnamed protein product [Discosporangium mesarthrocarpum]